MNTLIKKCSFSKCCNICFSINHGLTIISILKSICDLLHICDFHQMEELVMPYLSIMAEFRDNVRGLARSLKATDILGECDKLRDDTLPSVGVRLEDIEGILEVL